MHDIAIQYILEEPVYHLNYMGPAKNVLIFYFSLHAFGTTAWCVDYAAGGHICISVLLTIRFHCFIEYNL